MSSKRQAAGRWWQFRWQYVGVCEGTSGHAHRNQVPEILGAVHVLLAFANRFPSWTSPSALASVRREVSDAGKRLVRSPLLLLLLLLLLLDLGIHPEDFP